MKKIKVFWNICDLTHWKSVFDDQLSCMIKSNLISEADEITIMGNGNDSKFQYVIELANINPNIKYVNLSKDCQTLFEYPSLTYLDEKCKKSEENFAVFYLHLKGVSDIHWSNPSVHDWRNWLNWATIERWRENYVALEKYDISGPNWDAPPAAPWPHYSGNMWWANSNYVSKLTSLIHPSNFSPNKKSQFKFHGHWRYDCEAWIGSGNPKQLEIARSFKEGGWRHYRTRFQPDLYRKD